MATLPSLDSNDPLSLAMWSVHPDAERHQFITDNGVAVTCTRGRWGTSYTVWRGSFQVGSFRDLDHLARQHFGCQAAQVSGVSDRLTW